MLLTRYCSEGSQQASRAESIRRWSRPIWPMHEMPVRMTALLRFPLDLETPPPVRRASSSELNGRSLIPVRLRANLSTILLDLPDADVRLLSMSKQIHRFPGTDQRVSIILSSPQFTSQLSDRGTSRLTRKCLKAEVHIDLECTATGLRRENCTFSACLYSESEYNGSSEWRGVHWCGGMERKRGFACSHI
jgi:hypothetical protein